MTTRNWEDWATAVPVVAVVALAAVMGFAAASAGTQFATSANASAPVRYAMTITAKRLPAACKTQNAPAFCATFAENATVTVREAQ